MSGNNGRVIQVVMRGEDDLSASANKGAEALEALQSTSAELQETLAKTEGADKLAQRLDDVRTVAERAQKAYDKAQQEVEQLRDALNKNPDAKGLEVSLKTAERNARDLGREVDRLVEAEFQLEQQARAAGIDTARLGEEQDRLRQDTLEAKRAINEHGDALDNLRREQAAAARAAMDLEQRQQAAAKQAREILAGQQQLNESTSTYGERLRETARSMAAYVAGFLAIDAAIGAVRNGIAAMLKAGDQSERLANQMTALMGSVKAGEQATAWIQDFAKTTPLALNDVTEAFAQLKAFGIDPMDGTLQALVDQNEKLGGGQERLLGIVSAVGQAWAKQKLQTEEILQLVERGVPVWDLLGTVTGKTTAQLMDMASSGELGRDAIRQLVDEIGRGASGAAAANMSTLSGLTSQLSDSWQSFLSRIADSGALDYVKGRLHALSETIAAMAADGSLDRMAKSISDGFVGAASSVESAGKWVVRHAGELKLLAAAYAALKLASMAQSMANWAVAVQNSSVQMRTLRAATDATTAATTRLTAAQSAGAIGGVVFGKLGAVVARVAGGVATLARMLTGVPGLFIAAAAAGGPLGEMAAKLSPAVREANAAVERSKQYLRDQYEQAKLASEAMGELVLVQRRSSDELKNATEAEREAYRAKLKTQEAHQMALLRTAVIGKEAGQVAEQELKQARAELDKTRKMLADLDAAAGYASDALRGGLTVGALELIEKFNELRRSGMDAEQALADLGKSFDPQNAEQLRNMGQTLQYLGQYGVLSGEQIEQFLMERLQKLSGDDLVRLQEVARQVFTGMGRDAQALGLTMDASLNAALAKLGLDLEQINTGLDKGTRDTLAAFDQVIAQTTATGKSAEESAAIVVAAFKSAREKIDDPNALKQLEGAYQAWTQTSTEAGKAAQARMVELQAEAKAAAKEITGMEDALARVGAASSAMELANIGVAASQAFHSGRMSAKEYAQVQDAIKARYVELASAASDTGRAAEQGAEQMTRAQQMYNEALEDGIVTMEEARRISGQRMEEERRASGEAMELRRKDNEEARRDMQAMGDWASGVLSNAREPLAQMSAAALEAYDRLRGISTTSVGIDTSGLEATRASLRGVVDQLEAVKAAQGELIAKGRQNGLSAWQLEATRSSLEVQQAYLGQKASLQSLMDRYDSGEMSLRSFISAAKGAASGLNLLEDADLSGLQSALASAEQRMQALGDSTRNTLEGLQSELDQLRGNEEAAEARRFAQRQRELQAQLEEARASGDSEATSNISRALSVLREIQAETEQQRFAKAQQERAQQQQQVPATSQAPASRTPATVIRLETGRGKGIDLQVAEGEQTKLLDVLAEAGLRAI